jgi:hypothetical protein
VLVALYMTLMGASIAAVWTRDIVRGTQFDRSAGLLRARQPDGSLLVPHWVAEYATAAALLAGAAGLALDAGWAVPVSAAALGATFYTSVNSLGWVLADRRRRAYAVPMVVGAVGSVVCLAVLLLTG